ncbi:hypothetical protein EVAR_40621_1 [Eumeta japonica]|uniref:Uncharacterized protein n=1 Tax=Eumeta variegata TaxID=151549 RepID=A0A4C1XGE9_EUMVA|nr:hypothetical protein EVAR_40621_1 [Eumeta japonica]
MRCGGAGVAADVSNLIIVAKCTRAKDGCAFQRSECVRISECPPSPPAPPRGRVIKRVVTPRAPTVAPRPEPQCRPA